jgi:trehalose 6-phosphate phosphatase
VSARDLPADLQRALTEVALVPRLLVTSDFDGTLAPIVNHPPDARPIAAAARALSALATLPATTAALISGRAVQDLAALSRMPTEVHLVGSHGAEFDTGFLYEINETLLDEIKNTLHGIAAAYPGVTVEVKPASAALHVRNAAPDDARAALDEASAAAENWDAHITAGKAVLEFAVIQTDKGQAIDILREREDASAVAFFGDDVTDEKAFRRLRGSDVGVKVGPGDTLAEFRVESPEDVAVALEFLLEHRRSRRA